MGLGQTCINAFLALCLASAVLAFMLSVVVARLVRRRRMTAIVAFVLLCPLLALFANMVFHQTLFARWSQAQNELVPNGYPCLVYHPTFNSLCAKCSMSASDFDAWVESHPWPLKPIDEIDSHDQQLLGLKTIRKAYATESAPNGKQLRIYHVNGIAYISYNAF